jgi:hypothetical protein
MLPHWERATCAARHTATLMNGLAVLQLADESIFGTDQGTESVWRHIRQVSNGNG